MRVVLVHAYSSSNSGDGLLVREALDLVHSVFESPEVIVLALDPDSFEASEKVTYVHPITGQSSTPGKWNLLGGSLAAFLRGSRMPATVRRTVENADLVVGVGGGYMRGANTIEALKMLLVHAPQTQAATLNPATVYLPQSVGPFRKLPSQFIISRLNRVSSYFVRDNRSLELLDDRTTSRAPDNALLALADGYVAPSSPTATDARIDSIGLVARHLASTPAREERYVNSLMRVRQLTDAELLVQARARGNNDDEFYTRTFNEDAKRTLVQGTEPGDARVRAVVSVRLHGAIQSIRNGVPAVHLSYERKGWGAYEDLGLQQYVHNAFDFDAELVAHQAKSLSESADEYWASVDGAVQNLRSARDEIADTLRKASR